ncbi:MAG: tetratricopeptide repeat protein [Gammaproteobacteria bacterium]
MKQSHRFRFSLLLLVASAFPATSAALEKGGSIPNFSLQTIDGRSYTTNEIAKADLAVLYFFSTKCTPCAAGLTRLQQLTGELKEKAPLVLAIGKQSTSELHAYVQKLGLRLEVASADERTLRAFRAQHVYPTAYVLGPGGRVLETLQGDHAGISTLLLSLAEREQQREEPGAAKTIYASMKAEGDQSGIVQAGMGYSFLKEGQLAAAESSFRDLANSSQAQLAVRGHEGLAQTHYQQGRFDEALAQANRALNKAPDRAVPHLVKAKVHYRNGSVEEAEQEVVLASAERTVSDFDWQKADAHYAKANLLKKTRQPTLAVASYQKALDHNPYFVAALSNQGVALQEIGDAEGAVKAFTDLKQRHPSDRLVDSLLRQARAAIAEKSDIERQRYIGGLAKDLIQQYQRNQATAARFDDWTSPALALSIMGFESRGSEDLMAREGLRTTLPEELTQDLLSLNIKVVERAIVDKLLGELRVGSTPLADPDAALKIGRIAAARLLLTGYVSEDGKGGNVGMRLIDTETTAIVLPLVRRETGAIDPAAIAADFSKKISAAIKENYPLKGRIAEIDGDITIINLGKKHRIVPGMVFDVLTEGKPIELDGRILGYREVHDGQIEVTRVEDLVSYAKATGRGGRWEKTQKIISR